jgi:hypothetical protein
MVCLKKFGEWYQKTNKTEDTNKLTLLSFKIIAICKSCAFHDDLQAGTQKDVHPPSSPDLAPVSARSGGYGGLLLLLPLSLQPGVTFGLLNNVLPFFLSVTIVFHLLTPST